MTLGVAQDKHRRIGEIDFYGYGGLDLDRILENPAWKDCRY
jgi:hypothetical protein